MTTAIDRKPVFDEFRRILGRGFTPSEVGRIDAAFDRAEGVIVVSGRRQRRLGALSEKYESGGKGPGAVSTGAGDPGGVSYGTWQLASKTGTAADFVAGEGAQWPELVRHSPGTSGFSAAWMVIAGREPASFEAAQHAYIRRTHYDPAVRAVLEATGVDLDAMPDAVRDATWSVAVQHAGAVKILRRAIADVGARDPHALVEAIYDERVKYVLGLSLPPGTRAALLNRYRHERADALAMLGN